jgi:hypothetical protein
MPGRVSTSTAQFWPIGSASPGATPIGADKFAAMKIPQELAARGYSRRRGGLYQAEDAVTRDEGGVTL